MEQLKLVFAERVHQQIVNYHEAPKTESATDGAQIKLCPSQKIALRTICREENIGVSTFLRDALDIYIELFPYKEKLKKHHNILLSILNGLS